jgi:hypothetical protein
VPARRLDAVLRLGCPRWMSREVTAYKVAAVAGILLAAYVGLVFTQRRVPDAIIGWLGGPHGGVDRDGGVKVRYRLPGGQEDVAEVPGIAEARAADMIAQLTGRGLTLQQVRTGDHAREIGRLTGHEVGFDVWGTHDGEQRTVGYLEAASREELERVVAAAMAQGFALPPGSEIGYAQVAAQALERPVRWRTYELASQADVDSTMIADAMAARDPMTEQPIVLVELSEEGRDRFCALTRRLLGEKLAIVLGGRIRAAPQIAGPICGGRLSISQVGDDAEALAAALRVSPPLRPGSVIEARWQPPANLGGILVVARLVLALGAGLIVAVLAVLAIRIARPRWRSRMPSSGAFPWRRLAVTLIAPVAVYLLPLLSLPGIDEMQIQWRIYRAGLDFDERGFSVIALGVTPAVSAFVTVELIALAVPRLRWRRHDPRGRRALGRATAAVAVVIALVQGHFAATYLSQLPDSGDFVTSVWMLRLLTPLSLAAGTMLLTVIAGMISEHGLGNGYGAVLASTAALSLFPQLDRIELAAVVVIAAATACLLRWRIPGGDREPELRVPTSGLTGAAAFGGVAATVTALLALLPTKSAADVQGWFDVLRAPWLMFTGLGLSVVVWSWLFARPALVARVALQAGLARPAWSTWRRATFVTLAVLTVCLAVQLAAEPRLMLGLDAMIGTAVILDIIDDARARREHLAPAWIVHQIQYLGVVERVLADAEIPCHVHASNVRTLFAFFGPWAPAIVLVPEPRAQEARDRLDAALRAPTASIPVAQIHGATG